MPVTERRGPGAIGPLRPAPDPTRRTSEVEFDQPAFVIEPGGGTGGYAGSAEHNLASLWSGRFGQWRNAFEQQISRGLIRNWQLWRNFDTGPGLGPGQEWRDRTVVPQAFKEIATRVPRKVLGLFGLPEPYTIRGRMGSDERYEETVRVLIQESLDTIGLNDPMGEDFLVRMIDALTYCEVVGHVEVRPFWRREGQWFKTKQPGPDGQLVPVELFEEFYNNVDFCWYPITQVAKDVYGKRRWKIFLMRTSVEALQRENEDYRKSQGSSLYPGLDNAIQQEALGGTARETTDEPRDTEHWPLDDGGMMSTDPNETPAELWLAYDNTERTLTKLLNRRAVLDYGLADTPNGLDGSIEVPCVPIPGRAYGDSMLNWTGGLHTRQTRLSRARMDETMLNMFNQYLYREGVFKPSSWFWRPGGGAAINTTNPDKPISDSIFLVPRRPLPPEAYAEERYTQEMSESTAAADKLAQGAQGTDKSRDVTKAEIDQRVLQGSNRTQLETMYLRRKLVRPFIQQVFDLLRQNLDQPRMIRILDDPEAIPVDLTALQRPVDIIIGSPGVDITMSETLAELDRLVLMSKPDTAFAPWLKPREIAIAILKNTRTLARDSAKFVRTEEEKQKHDQEQSQLAAQQQGTAPPPGMAAPQGLPPGSDGAGPTGAAGPAGPNGATAGGLAVPSIGSVETI